MISGNSIVFIKILRVLELLGLFFFMMKDRICRGCNYSSLRDDTRPLNRPLRNLYKN